MKRTLVSNRDFKHTRKSNEKCLPDRENAFLVRHPPPRHIDVSHLALKAEAAGIKDLGAVTGTTSISFSKLLFLLGWVGLEVI